MSGSDVHAEEANENFYGVDSGYDADENRGPTPLRSSQNMSSSRCDEFWGTEGDIPMISTPKSIDFFNNGNNRHTSSVAVTSQVAVSRDQVKKVVCDW